MIAIFFSNMRVGSLRNRKKGVLRIEFQRDRHRDQAIGCRFEANELRPTEDRPVFKMHPQDLDGYHSRVLVPITTLFISATSFVASTKSPLMGGDAETLNANSNPQSSVKRVKQRLGSAWEYTHPPRPSLQQCMRSIREHAIEESSVNSIWGHDSLTQLIALLILRLDKRGFNRAQLSGTRLRDQNNFQSIRDGHAGQLVHGGFDA